MKKIIFFFFAVFIGCAPNYSVKEMPFYGKNDRPNVVVKEDGLFVNKEAEKYGSKQNASKHYSDLGWKYLYSTNIGSSIPFYRELNAPKKMNMAMENFNSAWSIDSLNAEAFWGMASIVSTRDKNNKYSQELMEKAIRCDSTNIRLWFDYGVSNMEYAEKSNSKDTLEINQMKKKATIGFEKVINSNAEEELKEKAKEFLGKVR